MSIPAGRMFISLKIFMALNSYKMMLGSKAPNYDTYGLLRTSYSHNPAKYSHIVVLTPHF